MLDQELKEQLGEYLKLLENNIVIKVSAGNDDVSQEMVSLINELAALSPKIIIKNETLPRTPSFSVNREGEDTGITFAGVPMGHEFTSLILALLQVSGRAPKIEPELVNRIKAIEGNYLFETYVSLSCHICPEVVQALNAISVLNPNITHTMIDGAVFTEEVESKGILAVPTVYLNGSFFESGRMTIEDIISRLGSKPDINELNKKEPFDVLVIGGGPAGVSAAIYAARKGIRVGIVAQRFGGQILDTLGIENFISVKYTEGPKLAANLEEHAKEYGIDIMKSYRVVNITK
ncbi:MAG: FAD-dependent oxidoreductase, partial [Bacilli bacterium]|nr:FAD-dependent oxidoreductase [Bacilli bacterium]